MNGSTNQTYWQTLKSGIQTSLSGLRLSFRHLKNARRSRNTDYVDQPGYFDQDTGIVTLQYPRESLPVPDVGRYRLHNEIEDCIVCDKCAKICPVDCIEIEAVKATEEIGKASDGSPIRLYAARFDIDMAKCCYCGLCTTVCPTECLTMTKAYDYSEFDVKDFIYAYSNLTPQEADEKRRLLDEFQREKEAQKAVKPVPAAPAAASEETTSVPAARPAFRPGVKRPVVPSEPAPATETAPATPVEEVPLAATPAEAPKPRPVFRPGVKKEIAPPPVDVPLPPAETQVGAETVTEAPASPKPRPVFKPRVVTSVEKKTESVPEAEAELPAAEVPAPLPEVPTEPAAEAPKPRPRPVFKPTPRKPPEA